MVGLSTVQLLLFLGSTQCFLAGVVPLPCSHPVERKLREVKSDWQFRKSKAVQEYLEQLPAAEEEHLNLRLNNSRKNGRAEDVHDLAG